MSAELSAEFTRVPVIDVHRGNLDLHLPSIIKDIQQSSFVAVDCELSGLGNRKKLNASSIDERYVNTCLVAKTRSIISLGISTFHLDNVQKKVPEEESNGHKNGDEEDSEEKSATKSWNYRVSTYNLMVLCGEDYIVEPGALKFLVEHGFDFRKQYSHGIQYLRGNDRDDEESVQPIRDIFSHIVKARTALVLHNGLIDLVFLYHNFYAALPDKLGTFMSDISEMFPQGVYDTKYIADYVSRTQASFLEFVFRKEQKINREKFQKKRPHVKLRFQYVDSSDVDWRYCGEEKEQQGSVEVCFSYAHHGHCPLGSSCDKSHDIDHIIKHRHTEKEKKYRKRKRPYEGNGSVQQNGHTQEETGNGEPLEQQDDGEDELIVPDSDKPPVNSGGHRAGFDAFMTGFALTTFLVHQTQIPEHPTDFSPASLNTQSLVNRIYLVCKDFPMLLAKSSFSKSSLEHYNKMIKLNLIQKSSDDA